MYYLKEGMDAKKACYERLYISNVQAIQKISHIKSLHAKVPFIPTMKSQSFNCSRDILSPSKTL